MIINLMYLVRIQIQNQLVRYLVWDPRYHLQMIHLVIQFFIMSPVSMIRIQVLYSCRIHFHRMQFLVNQQCYHICLHVHGRTSMTWMHFLFYPLLLVHYKLFVSHRLQIPVNHNRRLKFKHLT